MVTILMMSAKMASIDVLKRKAFWKKNNVLFSVYDATGKILSLDSNHIANLVMWQKFGKSTFSKRQVITTSVLKVFDKKNPLFKG